MDLVKNAVTNVGKNAGKKVLQNLGFVEKAVITVYLKSQAQQLRKSADIVSSKGRIENAAVIQFQKLAMTLTVLEQRKLYLIALRLTNRCQSEHERFLGQHHYIAPVHGQYGDVIGSSYCYHTVFQPRHIVRAVKDQCITCPMNRSNRRLRLGGSNGACAARYGYQQAQKRN